MFREYGLNIIAAFDADESNTTDISISDYELKLGDNNMSQIGFYLTYGNSTDLKTFTEEEYT